jgi:energy-coupling factor transporter transmembrane protein EcfT
MNLSVDSWRIEGDTEIWIIAILCILIALYLGVRTWLRMKKNRKIALWESFRFLIILLIILTLFNPERVEKVNQEQKSQIVCLQDVSDSMETKDVITNAGDPYQKILLDATIPQGKMD